MKTPQLDALKVGKMASGDLFLELSEKIGWEAFSDFANDFLNSVGGTVSEKHDGVDMRLWVVVIDGCDLRLVFEDHPVLVSLESSDKQGDAVIERLHQKLAQN